MITHYVPSLGLNKGLLVKDYESLDELEKAAGEEGACLRFANKYLIEKSALPTGRDKFAEELEKKTGFKMPVNKTTKKKPDGSVEEIETPALTEVQYIAAFRKAILSGTFEHVAFPKEEKLLEDALQNFADSLGAFPADAKRPERKPGLSRFPGWIKERAKLIFDNGTFPRWWEKMREEGIPIDELTNNREDDEVALCRAIKERHERSVAKEAKQYA